MARVGVSRCGSWDRFQGLVRLVIDVISAGHDVRIETVIRVNIRVVVERMVIWIEAQWHLLLFLLGVLGITILGTVVLRAIDGGRVFGLLRDTEARRLG